MLVALLALQLNGSAVVGTWNSYVLGWQWEVVVRKDDLDASPTWPELADDPPLSPRRAIQSAEVLLKRLVLNANEWRFRTLQLQQIGPPDRWVYVVAFSEPPPDPIGGIASSMEIVVLMNGRAVEPIRRPLPFPALR